MYTLIIPVLWTLLILIGIRKNDSPSEGAFTLNNSQILRGIFAIGIVIGHTGIYMDDKYLRLFSQLDILFVGVFLALSGYGIAYSVENKEKYLHLFLPKKFIYLIMISYLGYVAGTVNMALAHSHHTSSLLKKIYNFNQFFGDINWFIWELLALYTITYILAKFFKLSKTYSVIGILSILFIIIGCIFDIEKNYYSCCLCYFIGLLYYYKKDLIYEKLLSKKRAKAIALVASAFLTVIFICIFTFFNEAPIMLLAFVKNVAAICFIWTIISFLTIFKLKNPLYKFIGKISLEVYIFNVTVIAICMNLITDKLICGLVIMLANVIVAYIMHWITKLFKFS